MGFRELFSKKARAEALAKKAQVSNIPEPAIHPGPRPSLTLKTEPYNAGASMDSSRPATAWHPQESTVERAALPTYVDPVPAKTIPASEKRITLMEAITLVQPKPAVQETPKVANGFETFLQKAGRVALKVLGFASALQASPTVDAAESLLFGPAITNLITLWIGKAVAVESAGASALDSASQGASGEAKAALVIGAMTPEAQDIAKQLGASSPTQTDLKVINDAIVTILNTLKFSK